MATIAVVSAPYVGHLVPVTRLGAVLARHGHRVIVWTIEPFRVEVEAAGLEVRTLDQQRSPGPWPSWADGAAVLAADAERLIPVVIEQMLAERVDLVVHDTMAPWGPAAARWLGLPRISSNVLFLRGNLNGGGPQPPVDEAVKASLARSVMAIRRRWGVDLGSVMDIIANRSEVTLSYTTAEIFGGEPPDGWRFVGPLRDAFADDAGTDEPTIGDDDERPLVYMSLGTFVSARPDLYRAAIDGLSEEPVRLLLSGGGRITSAHLGRLPDNVTVSDRLQPSSWQHTVLRRASVFISHCGAGSMHESLCAGVPMVCMPLATDQPAVGRRVVELGAGVMLSSYTPAAVREGVVRVLAEPAFTQHATVLGRRLRAYDGVAVALSALEEVLR